VFFSVIGVPPQEAISPSGLRSYTLRLAVPAADRGREVSSSLDLS
jgi:hypothetical protein